MDERTREGVTIDVCNKCRGIWLDRGELEKLIARAAEPVHHQRYDDERGPPSSDAPGRHKKKRSWLDIFD